MNEIIPRALQGMATEVELRALRRWRDEDPENEEEYQRFAEIWRAVADHDPVRSGVRPPDTARILDLARQRSSRFRSWHRRTLRAVAVVAALGGGYLLAHWGVDVAVGPAAAAAEIVTGPGESSTARLDDGTIIRLAPESRLVVHPEGSAREVFLEGRAYFVVAPDSLRSFRVGMAAGDIRVLGTRFEVVAGPRDLRLVVVQGKVAVESTGGSAEVGRSEVSHVRDGGAPSRVRVDNVWEFVDWMGGFLAFESTPLREVGQELERQFEKRLEFTDPGLAEETVTVWFGDEALDEVVGVVCRLVAAQCSIEGSIVRVSREP